MTGIDATWWEVETDDDTSWRAGFELERTVALSVAIEDRGSPGRPRKRSRGLPRWALARERAARNRLACEQEARERERAARERELEYARRGRTVVTLENMDSVFADRLLHIWLRGR